MTAIALLLAALLQAAAPIARLGTITGQIQTREGFPAVAVRVSAIPAPPATGVRAADGQNYWATPAPASTSVTDVNGRYRLANVPPGRYYVVAGMLGQATYYPGAVEAERGTAVIVGSDSNQPIDFKLALAHGGRLSGRVSPPVDEPNPRAVLSGLRLEELLEMPLAADGTFTFGHVPKGAYLLSIYPTPPGARSLVFEVADADVTLDFKRPAVRTVKGRITTEKGPLPRGLLAFTTPQSHVSAAIEPDGTFTTKLHPGRHQPDIVGLPVGYAIASVRVGTDNAAQGITVDGADVSGVEIMLTSPRSLPAIRGRVNGVAAARLGTAMVEMTGPIVGLIRVPVRPDGTFEVPAITAGRYTVQIPQLPEVMPVSAVVRAGDTEVIVDLSAK
jgi:hypothetical protein